MDNIQRESRHIIYRMGRLVMNQFLCWRTVGYSVAVLLTFIGFVRTVLVFILCGLYFGPILDVVYEELRYQANTLGEYPMGADAAEPVARAARRAVPEVMADRAAQGEPLVRVNRGVAVA